jgi:hypothetical protein
VLFIQIGQLKAPHKASPIRRRVGRDAGGVADELLSHLAVLVGSEVKVTLEIEGKEPNGVPENTVRIVTENRPYSEIRYAGI